MTGGNFHRFREASDIPLHTRNGLSQTEISRNLVWSKCISQLPNRLEILHRAWRFSFQLLLDGLYWRKLNFEWVSNEYLFNIKYPPKTRLILYYSSSTPSQLTANPITVPFFFAILWGNYHDKNSQAVLRNDSFLRNYIANDYRSYTLQKFLDSKARIEKLWQHFCHLTLPGHQLKQLYLPLRAKCFGGNINIYLHFMSFLHTNKTQVVESPPWVKQGPAYSTQSISWLLMSWRRKEPGHQQPWYWPS